MNPPCRLREYGQSPWLDLLSRELLNSRQLQRLIETDCISGITSNPAIFDRAISGSNDYQADIRKFADQGMTAIEIYHQLVVADVQAAADLLLPIYEKSNGVDGYVSLEVSPRLANNTQGTIREAHSLWAAVHRPNVMIKIPGTLEGIPAIEECIASGININVTLLFGIPRHRAVSDAYLSGLERRLNNGQDLTHLRSVASFFLSRIDTLIDSRLQEIPQRETLSINPNHLQGQAAISCAKLAYQQYKELFSSARFQNLAQKGARKQWLLWGSTGTKNRAYSDTKYVDTLIGPETITTMPIETLEAYRDHGNPALQLENDIEKSASILHQLSALGIDLNEITSQLEQEGIEKFNKPFTNLLAHLEAIIARPVS